MAPSLQRLFLLGCVGLAMLLATAGEPLDPLKDFTVPGKLVDDVTVEDFVFRDSQKIFFEEREEFAALLVNKDKLPILGDQGITWVIINVPPGKQNSPHYHPRATELLMVTQGEMVCGIADTRAKNDGGPRYFETVLKAGDVVVLPRGLAHFQLNRGNETAIAVEGLNSANPGVVRILDTLDKFEETLSSN